MSNRDRRLRKATENVLEALDKSNILEAERVGVLAKVVASHDMHVAAKVFLVLCDLMKRADYPVVAMVRTALNEDNESGEGNGGMKVKSMEPDVDQKHNNGREK